MFCCEQTRRQIPCSLVIQTPILFLECSYWRVQPAKWAVYSASMQNSMLLMPATTLEGPEARSTLIGDSNTVPLLLILNILHDPNIP